MAFRYTPTPTPSVSPTISLTPSITPSFTPTTTACPGTSPTPTPSITASPTITPSSETPTPTPSLTPTMTQTPTATRCNTVTGLFGYMEPCIGGTIDDYMGAQVYLSNNVSVDTEFVVDVYYVLPGNACGTGESTQTFYLTVLAGEAGSNFDACTSGFYISTGAIICSTCIVSCDNPSICIPPELLC